jgi:hypothetical protein
VPIYKKIRCESNYYYLSSHIQELNLKHKKKTVVLIDFTFCSFRFVLCPLVGTTQQRDYNFKLFFFNDFKIYSSCKLLVSSPFIQRNTQSINIVKSQQVKQSGLAIKKPPKKTRPIKPKKTRLKKQKKPPRSGFYWVFLN